MTKSGAPKLAAVVLAALAMVAAACADDDDDTTAITRGTAGSWLPEHADEIELTADNTAPVIDQELAEDKAFAEHWMWDWWPIRDRDGEVADVDGWQVAIALAAADDVLPGQRHDIAELRYQVSSDGGRTWQEGGAVFPENSALGARQWAGSTMYDNGTVYVFYTAAGEDGVRHEPPTIDELNAESGEGDANDGSALDDYQSGEDISYEQRMVVAVGRLSGNADGVEFSDWEQHQLILEGDGELYASTAGTEGGAGEIDAFRDPWYYRHGEEEYLLFTATMPEADCDGDGVVGIARRASEQDLSSWELLPPLLDSHCVNNELERPHIITRGDQYYLLFTTHRGTFDDEQGVIGPEGLYGFVGPDLFGPYEPLNGSGLVLANPEEEEYQAYSWMTLPNGVVTSFFQYFGLEGDQDLTYVGEQDPQFQVDRFAGTFAPSIEIEFDGATTRVVGELGPGHLGS